MATITPITLTVNTTDDLNDGSANNNLSLRDAIIIANTNPDNNYIIELEGGKTYLLSQKGSNEDQSSTGDFDILNGSNITIKSVGTGQATIDGFACNSQPL